jgi:hypothetical protein
MTRGRGGAPITIPIDTWPNAAGAPAKSVPASRSVPINVVKLILMLYLFPRPWSPTEIASSQEFGLKLPPGCDVPLVLAILGMNQVLRGVTNRHVSRGGTR